MHANDLESVSLLLASMSSDDRGLNFLGPASRTSLSFRKLAELTGDIAARWNGLGHRLGDRVVIVAIDEQEFVKAFLSAIRAGVVPVPVFPPFAFGQLDAYQQGLRRICQISGAGRCLVSKPLVELLSSAQLPCPVSPLEELFEARPGRTDSPGPSDVAFLQFTSGSTAAPKGVVLTHRSLMHHMEAIRRHGLAVDGARDRAVSWLPLFHDMGLIGFLFVPLLAQNATWYMSPLQFARDPLSWVRCLSEVDGTISYAPNFAYGLVTRRATDEALAGLDLSAWRVAGCGAEPVRSETLRGFAERFAVTGFDPKAFKPSYGLAEATLAVSMSPNGGGLTTLAVDPEVLAAEGKVVPPGPDAARTAELVSCGVPLHGTEVRIVGDDGSTLGTDQEGQVLVRSGSLTAGYFADPAATRAAWQDGWLRTGDNGFLHDGQLYITGRIKDVIIVNGRNHQPQDIEWIAAQVPGVRAGNVVALPAAGRDSEGVRLVLEARDEAVEQDLAADVRRHIRAQLGLAVTEVVVLPREGLPKTSSGKLRRSHTAVLYPQRAAGTGSSKILT